jgi:hypothetical protein
MENEPNSDRIEDVTALDSEIAKILQEEENEDSQQIENDRKLAETLQKEEDERRIKEPARMRNISADFSVDDPDFILAYHIPNWKQKLEADFRACSLKVLTKQIH